MSTHTHTLLPVQNDGARAHTATQPHNPVLTLLGAFSAESRVADPSTEHGAVARGMVEQLAVPGTQEQQQVVDVTGAQEQQQVVDRVSTVNIHELL